MPTPHRPSRRAAAARSTVLAFAVALLVGALAPLALAQGTPDAPDHSEESPAEHAATEAADD